MDQYNRDQEYRQQRSPSTRNYRPTYTDYSTVRYGRPPQESLMSKFFRAAANVVRHILNIRIKVKFILPVLILAVGAVYYLTNSKAIASIGGKSEYAEASKYIEIKDVAEKYYIDGVDRTSMADSAATAMIAGLNDKWSYYMSADEYRSYQLYSSSEYEEIGFTMVSDSSGGYQVVSVTNNSAAALAGLTSGMVIESVDGVSVLQSDIDSVRTMIRSKLNSSFVLGIRHGDEITVDCTSTYTSSVFSRLEKTQAGYVQIYDFEAGTGQDAIQAVEDLLFQGAESLVIDIRNNPGGLANEAAIFLDYLLPKCELFSLVGSNGKQTVYSSDSICVQMPMVILINGGTYAEAEVFAQVIEDNSWATVMGETTSGSTRLQQTVALSDGSAIRLSTNSYITAAGVDISLKGGVVPDYIIYNTDASTVGTTTGTTGTSDGTSTASNDEQLMAALKYLS